MDPSSLSRRDGHPTAGVFRWSSAETRTAPNAVVVVDVSSGSSRVYPAPSGAVLSNAAMGRHRQWADRCGRRGSHGVQRGAPGRLLRLDTGSGQYLPLGWLENFPSLIDLLPDGRLVLSSLWCGRTCVRFRSARATSSAGRWLTSGMAIDRQPVYSPDGKWVMFSSNRGGTLDLWEVSVETGEMHRVTDDPQDDWDPEYGPEGSRCIGVPAEAAPSRSGQPAAMEARRASFRETASTRRILRSRPTTEWVFYSSAHPAQVRAVEVPVTGGDGERLLPGGTLIPDLSPDGRYLSVITGVGTLSSKLEVFDHLGEEAPAHPVSLHVVPGNLQNGRSRITPDGIAVVYVHAERTDARCCCGGPCRPGAPASARSTRSLPARPRRRVLRSRAGRQAGHGLGRGLAIRPDHRGTRERHRTAEATSVARPRR